MTPDRIRCASGARIEAAIPQKTRQRQTTRDQDTAEKTSTTSPTTAPEGSNTPRAGAPHLSEAGGRNPQDSLLGLGNQVQWGLRRRTIACRRPLTASAPASLPLPAAPEAWRSPLRFAPGGTRSSNRCPCGALLNSRISRTGRRPQQRGR